MLLGLSLQLAQIGRTLCVSDSVARGSDDLVKAGSHKESEDYTGRGAEDAGSDAQSPSCTLVLQALNL